MKVFTDKKCKRCGGLFTPTAPCNIYCQDKCRIAYMFQRYRNRGKLIKTAHQATLWKAANRDRAREHSRRDNARRRAEFRIWLDAKKAGPCTDCGRTFPPECMDFDHVRGQHGTRVNIQVAGKPRAVLEQELLKCELVCACCHRTRTRKRMLEKSDLVVKTE